MAFWCLFDFTIREISSTNITLKYSILEVTGKKQNDKEVQFDYFNELCIQGFDNAQY